MSAVFETTADDQTIEIPAGVHRGHLSVSHQRCRFVGPGAGKATILAAGGAGQVSSLIRPTVPVDRLAVAGVGFDADGLAEVSVPLEVGGGIGELVLDDVAVLGTHRGATAIDNRGRLLARRLFINGDGGGIRHAPEASSTVVTRARVHGGRYGFVNVTGGAAGSQPGINITGLVAELYYWAVPRCEEAQVTAVGPDWVDVASHVVEDRSLYDVLRFLTPLGTFDVDRSRPVFRGARRWDRVESASRHWTQVLAVAADGTLTLDHWHAPGSARITSSPGERVTIFRPSLGCLFGFDGNRLLISTPSAPDGHWRGVEGGLTPPAMRPGSRLDILRVKTDVRDLDTGGILCGETALAPVFADCTVIGSWSDGITVYSVDAIVAACRSLFPQDMGLTFGAVRALACIGARAGRHGFSVNGLAEIIGCAAIGNGLHNDGAGGAGVDVGAAGIDSFLDVTCVDNLGGGIVGARTAADPPTDAW